MRKGSVGIHGGACLFPRAERTVTLGERLRGLLGRPPLTEDEALWLDRCNSVHSFAMTFEIDVAYLGGRGEVRKLVAHLRPWRMSAYLPASATLEMPAGSIDRLGMKRGMQIEWTGDEGAARS